MLKFKFDETLIFRQNFVYWYENMKIINFDPEPKVMGVV
jgi:hypothetical protein